MSAGKSLLNEALDHHSAGRLTQAEQLYRTILQNDPHNGDANNLLGALLHQTGNSQAAEQFIGKAVNLYPDRSAYQINLAVVYEEQKKLQEAIQVYNRLLSDGVKEPGIFFNLGNVYCRQDRLHEACEAFYEAIRLDPGFANVYFNLANTCRVLEKYPEAIEAYEKALQQTPDNPDILCNIGCALHSLGRYRDAIERFKQALSIQPSHLNSLYNLGQAYFRAGRIDNAVTAFRKAIEIDSSFCNAWTGLAGLYEQGGNFAAARDSIDNALRINPNNPDAQRISAALLRRDERSEEALDILNQISPADSAMDSAMMIHFEYGRNYDRIGNPDQAFGHFSEANSIQMDLRSYGYINKKEYLELIDRDREKFLQLCPASLPRTDLAPCPNPPVFVIGFPRSGTTLTHMILDSHRRLQVMDEQPALHRLAMHLRGDGTGDYLTALSRITEKEQAQLQTLYFQVVDDLITRKPDHLLVDKMPLNILYIPLIQTIFPGAKILLVIRHPYDACLSNFMQMYELNNAMANFSTLTDAAVLYDKIMTTWHRFADLLQPDVHMLRYEDLTENLEQETRKIFTFLGLEWDDNVLRFDRHARNLEHINTPSYHQVTQPIYTSSVYRWKGYQKYFTEAAPLLDPHVRFFGYTDPA